MKHFRILLVLLLVLAFTAPLAFAADERPVIGKLHIKKGAQVLLIIPVAAGPDAVASQMFGGIAFKDQVFYIHDKAVSPEDATKFGYLAGAQGFSHDCPAHGEEVFEEEAFIMVPSSSIDENGNGIGKLKGLLRVEIF